MCLPRRILAARMPTNLARTRTHSRALPAFTIHTAVRQAKKAFANVQNPRVRTWAPTVTGLSIVPVLPYLFDKPVEHATDVAFEWIEKQLVRSSEASGKSEL